MNRKSSNVFYKFPIFLHFCSGLANPRVCPKSSSLPQQFAAAQWAFWLKLPQKTEKIRLQFRAVFSSSRDVFREMDYRFCKRRNILAYQTRHKFSNFWQWYCYQRMKKHRTHQWIYKIPAKMRRKLLKNSFVDYFRLFWNFVVGLSN